MLYCDNTLTTESNTDGARAVAGEKRALSNIWRRGSFIFVYCALGCLFGRTNFPGSVSIDPVRYLFSPGGKSARPSSSRPARLRW